MPEPDFESIMKKYRSLMGSASSQGGSQTPPSAMPDRRADTSEDVLERADNCIVENILAKDRPSSDTQVDLSSDEDYESIMLKNLFAQAEQDEWTPQAVLERSAKLLPTEDEKIPDLSQAEFARRLYHYEMDLRQHYNPDLGMYPGQALYVPKRKSSPENPPPPIREISP